MLLQTPIELEKDAESKDDFDSSCMRLDNAGEPSNSCESSPSRNIY